MVKPWAHCKYPGYVLDWPWVRLHYKKDEFDVLLKEEVWPPGAPTEAGVLFTMHMRGDKFSHIYVLKGPQMTRSEYKRILRRARERSKWLREHSA